MNQDDVTTRSSTGVNERRGAATRAVRRQQKG
jgi:hypothetical protein